MLAFFDFMYYIIYKWYEDNNDKGSELGGSCAVSGFQTMNILTLIWTYNYFFSEGELFLSKIASLIILFTLFIFNYIRYIQMRKFDKDAQEIKWKEKSLTFKKDFRGYLNIYIAISLIFFIGFIIYSARKKM